MHTPLKSGSSGAALLGDTLPPVESSSDDSDCRELRALLGRPMPRLLMAPLSALTGLGILGGIGVPGPRSGPRTRRDSTSAPTCRVLAKGKESVPSPPSSCGHEFQYLDRLPPTIDVALRKTLAASSFLQLV